jgi:LCP family protein required for cell wall assembly
MNNFDGINHHLENSIRTNLQPRRRKRRIWKWLLIIILIGAAALVLAGSSLLSKFNQIFAGQQNVFTRVGKLFISEDKPLQGEDQGQVNVLLLGMGGPGHDGPLLTDTMIVASINTNTSEINLVSIPRDFMIRYEGRGFNKINAAYAFAESAEEGSGGTGALKVAEQVTGLKIPYFASIDFKGFVKAVDQVGGLDITVDTTFTDSQYPDYNNGYLPPQTFTAGPEHMDGERALIFSRSRHGTNGEGSDFARSERQKKVMLAFKDKLLALNIKDIATINNLLTTVSENFRTNFEPYELKRLADMAGKFDANNVYSLSLEPQGALICNALVDLSTGRPAPAPAPAAEPDTPEAEEEDAVAPETPDEEQVEAPAVIRAYVVVPCAGKQIEDVHEYVQSSFSIAGLIKEEAVIEVQNTTGQSAVLQSWRALSELGVEIKFTTSRTPVDRSILYDNSNGSKPKTLDYIKRNHSLAPSDLPYTQSEADFVVILGKDLIQ